MPECEIGLLKLMILLMYADFWGNQLLKKLKKCPKQFVPVPPHQLGRCLKEWVFFWRRRTCLMEMQISRYLFTFHFPPCYASPQVTKYKCKTPWIQFLSSGTIGLPNLIWIHWSLMTAWTPEHTSAIQSNPTLAMLPFCICKERRSLKKTQVNFVDRK